MVKLATTNPPQKKIQAIFFWTSRVFDRSNQHSAPAKQSTSFIENVLGNLGVAPLRSFDTPQLPPFAMDQI